MDKSARKDAFLDRVRECVLHYQPLLEDHLSVQLGKVTVRDLQVWNWTRELVEFGEKKWLSGREVEKGRPVNFLEKSVVGAAGVMVSVLMFFPVWFRFWAPELLMKWDRRDSCIYVSFYGWDAKYFEKNEAKIDQWVVHELAHGAWEKLAEDGGTNDGDPVWRLWNEGFAHFVADELFRDNYRPGTALTSDWSEFRRDGKLKVAAMVRSQGEGVLREIPRDWREFASESAG